MFALITVIIYRKCKYFLIRAYVHRQQFTVTHLLKIVTIFKKSKLKFSIFEYKIAKSHSPHVPSVAQGSVYGFLVLQSHSHINRSKKYPFTAAWF